MERRFSVRIDEMECQNLAQGAFLRTERSGAVSRLPRVQLLRQCEDLALCREIPKGNSRIVFNSRCHAC